ncbi:hypothetical protein PGTUg99_000669 [Puccinia graminis f. sp. tritici]|uniref:Uncharacterized protein n=1 Tax=Puccinia graminis f. sp. tritici TaxID=56615 RepID=A0A5B0RGI2_PUCGR|nr:hypothetical protein PGTUg99_000669 [Puccinia graminis f. sp. tritici]
MLTMIALNRFASELPEEPDESAYNQLVERVKGYAKRGPLMAKEAVELGLLTGTMYKEELLSKIILGENPLVLDETDQRSMEKKGKSFSRKL